jgi:hypothetical protein
VGLHSKNKLGENCEDRLGGFASSKYNEEICQNLGKTFSYYLVKKKTMWKYVLHLCDIASIYLCANYILFGNIFGCFNF